MTYLLLIFVEMLSYCFALIPSSKDKSPFLEVMHSVYVILEIQVQEYMDPHNFGGRDPHFRVSVECNTVYNLYCPVNSPDNVQDCRSYYGSHFGCSKSEDMRCCDHKNLYAYPYHVYSLIHFDKNLT